MIQPGEVISYLEMCRAEDVNLQRGMNYRLRRDRSVFLMSRRLGAPYADHVEDGGRVLIYEGHDSPRQKGGPDPKTIDQPVRTPAGSLTENGKFLQAVRRIGDGEPAEIVQVYEKIGPGFGSSTALSASSMPGRSQQTVAGYSSSASRLSPTPHQAPTVCVGH